ncbi:hypothetical protein N7520_010031 [Penicillium odoratum]|uniref:uncharacterized protein n=1 Tax=Penicillium odoratum TaxID=1167516 RepID=UPI002547EDE8|nr:uncharacterized protein N7520_010031 [Penicillium odoratum]KAJ5753114.1 hypothetical protein N7520_010031 [Penicillium odoratum]
MRTHSSHERVTFNLIYDHITLSLVNDGLDITFHSDDKAYGWNLPSCRTYDTITINEQVIHIDPQHSLPAIVRDVRGSLKLFGGTVHISGYVATLNIVSVVEHQLLLDSTGLGTAYEGFVTFSGEFLDASVEGCGLVEIVQ